MYPYYNDADKSVAAPAIHLSGPYKPKIQLRPSHT